MHAADNIRVNAVNPGPIATEMVDISWDMLTDPEIVAERKTKQPLRPDGPPHGRGLRRPLLRIR